MVVLVLGLGLIVRERMVGLGHEKLGRQWFDLDLDMWFPIFVNINSFTDGY